MKVGSVMYRSRNGQIPAAKRVVIPKNRADGRRFERHGNRSLRGPESKSARRVARRQDEACARIARKNQRLSRALDGRGARETGAWK